jgi:lysyl endopeptidase
MRYILLPVLTLAATVATAGPSRGAAIAPSPPFEDAALYRAPLPLPVYLAAPNAPARQIILSPTVSPPEVPVTGSDFDGRQIGYVLPAPPDILETTQWQPALDGGSVIKVELSSLNAEGLRVQIAGLVGSGLEVRPYAPGSGAVIGSYTAVNDADADGWWSPMVFGNTFGLELHLPAGAAMPLRPPTIRNIVMAGCDNGCDKGPQTTLACHNDVTCFPAWAAEATGVAKIVFVEGTGCFICSGSALNRSAGDFSPIFLTANHCVNSQVVANTVEFLWFYQTPNCNGTPPDANKVPCTLGSLLLKNRGDYDCSLLGMYSAPPAGVQYEGWSTAAWGYGDAITGISHPKGSWKRISFGTLSDSGIRDYNDNGKTITVSVWLVNFNNGTVEGGSSGSPLFDSAHRVRGPLTGSSGGCTPNGVGYGRFDLAYGTLSPYLDSRPSPVYVSPGGGGAQDGTAGNPLPSVYAGMFCVTGGDTVVANAGTYVERETLWRPMRITTTGGYVRIGG